MRKEKKELLKQLYEATLSEFRMGVYDGICASLSSSKGWEARQLLKQDFRKRKPGIFSKEFYRVEFYKGRHFAKPVDYNPGYWWSCNKDGDQRRILFLEKIIKSLE